MSVTEVNTERSPGPGASRGKAHVRDDRHDTDHEVFQFLLSNHSKITRKVTNRDDGVVTLTESDDPDVAAKIKEHVKWMQHRVEKTEPIRLRDPLFHAAIIARWLMVFRENAPMNKDGQ